MAATHLQSSLGFSLMVSNKLLHQADLGLFVEFVLGARVDPSFWKFNASLAEDADFVKRTRMAR